MNTTIFEAKQKELKEIEPCFKPCKVSSDKDSISTHSVICVDSFVGIVEDVEGEKVRCSDFFDDGFRVVKKSDDIYVVGHLIV